MYIEQMDHMMVINLFYSKITIEAIPNEQHIYVYLNTFMLNKKESVYKKTNNHLSFSFYHTLIESNSIIFFYASTRVFKYGTVADYLQSNVFNVYKM